jgi:hypothetical protein
MEAKIVRHRKNAETQNKKSTGRENHAGRETHKIHP